MKILPYYQALKSVKSNAKQLLFHLLVSEKYLKQNIGKHEYEKQKDLIEFIELCQKLSKGKTDDNEGFSKLYDASFNILWNNRYILGLDTSSNPQEEIDNFFREIAELAGNITSRLADLQKAMESKRKFLTMAGKAAAAVLIGASLMQLKSQIDRIIGYSAKKIPVTEKVINEYRFNGLRIAGINYDTGTGAKSPQESRIEFSQGDAENEMHKIFGELNCNAVRVSGSDIKRLETGINSVNQWCEAWISPRIKNMNKYRFLLFLSDCAKLAEKYRKQNKKIVFILGNEISLDLKGFVKGSAYEERVANLSNGLSKETIEELKDELNSYLKKAVWVVKRRFNGTITYAAGEWESELIDWSIFDIISVNKYYNKWNRGSYVNDLRKLKQIGIQLNKPIVITEFGCACYTGADELGQGGYEIPINWEMPMPNLKEVKERNEDIQANYITNLLNLYLKEGIYGAFVYTFIETMYKDYNDIGESYDPKKDLDMASFGIIKLGLRFKFTPKKSYYAISNSYGQIKRQLGNLFYQSNV